LIENIFLGSKIFGLLAFKELCNKDPKRWMCIIYDDNDDPRSVIDDFLEFCRSAGIKFLVTKSNKTIAECIILQNPSCVFVCGFYRILPKSVIEKKIKILGIHHGPLPRYRGAAPVVWQLLQNEEFIGSSLFFFDKGMDSGDIIKQIQISNRPEMYVGECLSELEKMWLTLLPDIFNDLKNNSVTRTSQNSETSTYCAPRKPIDGKIDWTQSATIIARFIRAQSDPYPGAFFVYKDIRWKIHDFKIFERPTYGVPGRVAGRIDDYTLVCCGESTGLLIRSLKAKDEIVAANTIMEYSGDLS